MSGHPKRQREYRDSADEPMQDGQRVRYSDLPPDVKLQRRREERLAKKERDRTLAYFKSVQGALEAQASGAGDPSMLASIVDGFFVELIKLLKADPTLHLLRNGLVCRVIESALANSLLLHSKSLLYVLLGHLFDVAASPTASYVLETLLASLTQALAAMAEDDGALDAFAAEMAEGGAGTHVGSGAPSAATLLTCVADELAERAAEVLFHEAASRAVRAVLLVLGGLPIRGAPPPARAVRFERPLAVLGEALVAAVTAAFRETPDAELWLAIARVPTASFIVQSLLRVSAPDGSVAAALRVPLSRPPVLRDLLLDPLGSHLFGATLQSPGAEADGPWGSALDVLVDALPALLDVGGDGPLRAGRLLQDFAIFARSAAALERLWAEALEPHLGRLLSAGPAAAPALCALTRRVAFAGTAFPAFSVSSVSSASDGAKGPDGSARGVPPDLCAALRADAAAGAVDVVPPPSLAFQRCVTVGICRAARTLSPKGAAQLLLVDRLLGDRGAEVARGVLHFRPAAASVFVHAMDKLRVDDVSALARTSRGSAALQQYLRVGSLLGGERVGGTPLARRVLRRLAPLLPELVADTCGAFVVEVLYEVAPLEVKEEIVRQLTPIYQGLARGAAKEDGGRKSFVTRKVMEKCCVELYTHRPEDWTKQARRQCQVQKLMHRMSAVEL